VKPEPPTDAEISAKETNRPPGSAGLLTLSETIPAIESGVTGLSVSGGARRRPFLAEGARASVTGIESRPGFLVRFGRCAGAGIGGRADGGIGASADGGIGASADGPIGASAEGRLGASAETGSADARIECARMGVAATVHLFPGLVRREMAGPAGMIRETVMVAPSLPLVVGQWSSGTESAIGLLSVLVASPPGQADGWRVLELADSVVLLGSADERLAVGCSPTAGPIRFDADGSGAVVVTSEPAAHGGLVSLIVSAGREREVRSALSAVRHLRGHAIRAAAAPEGTLALRTTLPEIDDAVAWLGARIAGQCRRMGAGVGLAALTTGLAAIAAGRRDAIPDLLPRGSRDHGSPPAVDAWAVRALLSARFASTFGDASRALHVTRTLFEKTEDARRPSRSPGGRPTGASALTRVAARHLAEALHHSAHPDTITTLRDLAAHPSDAQRSRNAARAGVERRLPMLGPRRGEGDGAQAPGEVSEPTARWIEGLLRGDPEAPPPTAGRAKVRAAREACAAFRTDPDRAWAAWRGLLSGASQGGVTTTIWDPDAGSPDESLTAELILGLAHGLLGVAPDAPTGRIRIAPRLPSHLDSFGVDGIRVGDATLGMRYHRVSSRHRFELVPETVPVPPFVVFEPSVPGAIGAVRIDDGPAKLEPRREGARSIVSVQLSLDGTRRIEIECEPDAA